VSRPFTGVIDVDVRQSVPDREPYTQPIAPVGSLGRGLLECAYAPMVELLRHLEAHGFTNYIASGGDRDFMRPVTHELYAIPSERVIGSSNALQWTDDEREFAYTGGAEQALERAAEHGWTVASIKRDWAAVFPAG
jgi:hypothetical protein